MNDEIITPGGEPAPESLPDTSKAESPPRSRRDKLGAILRNSFVALTVLALVTLVTFTLWVTAFSAAGEDMAPTIQKGDLVLAVKQEQYAAGDVVAFYHNNDVMIKRIAALGGDEVDIDEAGALYVNGTRIDEPYAVDPSEGDCDVTFPCKVLDGRVFVLGDNRPVSGDSRLEQIGSVSETLIIGKIIFGVWPLSDIGFIK